MEGLDADKRYFGMNEVGRTLEIKPFASPKLGNRDSLLSRRTDKKIGFQMSKFRIPEIWQLKSPFIYDTAFWRQATICGNPSLRILAIR